MARNEVVASLLVAHFLSAIACAEWPQFRGENATGVADSQTIPIEFGPDKNVLWTQPLASGHSSPCVTDQHVFVTTYEPHEKQLSVVCLERTTGKTLWARTVDAAEIEQGHPSFNPASSTPASDGERVIAYFGSFGLICFSTTGDLLWELKMPLAKSYGGNAISPVLVNDRVILYRANYTDHFLLAVDKTSGETLWKTPFQSRFGPQMACTATPIVSGERILLHTVNAIQAYDVNSGALIWQVDAPTTATSTPVLAGNELIVATWNQTGEPALVPEAPPFDELLKRHDANEDGQLSQQEMPRMMLFHRSEGTEAPENGAPVRYQWIDTDENGQVDLQEWNAWRQKTEERRTRMRKHGVLAIQIDGEGLLADDLVRHLEDQAIPEVPSPLYYDGYVYFVKNGGILTCLELATGKRVYRIRTGGRGTHYASPIIVGDKLLTIAGDGRICVIALGPEPQVIATNEMGEPVYATPAVADNVLYVRTHGHLYAFAEQDAK